MNGDNPTESTKAGQPTEPLEMTEPTDAAPHGARVYLLNNGQILIKQTILSGGRYVIDGRAEHREQFVPQGDDQRIAAAIRNALAGGL